MVKDSQELRIEYMPLDALVKWPKNPKTHITEKINKSMERFGYNDPIAIDEATQRVVEGHGRIDALQQRKVLGLDPPQRVVVRGKDWLVPVLRGISFKNAKEAEAYLLNHNQLVVVGASRWNSKQNFTPNVICVPSGYKDLGEPVKGLSVPFPCCPNYEQKAWRLLAQAQERRGPFSALFLNVIGNQ